MKKNSNFPNRDSIGLESTISDGMSRGTHYKRSDEGTCVLKAHEYESIIDIANSIKKFEFNLNNFGWCLVGLGLPNIVDALTAVTQAEIEARQGNWEKGLVIIGIGLLFFAFQLRTGKRSKEEAKKITDILEKVGLTSYDPNQDLASQPPPTTPN